jgi:hypothetical protein
VRQEEVQKEEWLADEGHHVKPDPRRPREIDPFALSFLERLQDDPSARAFVLGGYFALKHYLDYRSTNDIDAWWTSAPREAALDVARAAFRETAAEFGWQYRERSWGDTVSLEAWDEARKAFSFQIAERTVELGPPLMGLWGNIGIESLDDNVGAKMNALVSRGAPRDFVDIKTIVDAGIAGAQECWSLWLRKNPSATIEYGKMAVQSNLAALIARSPLEKLPAERREAAAALRAWFRDEFAAL